jgi:hypothetical protein
MGTRRLLRDGRLLGRLSVCKRQKEPKEYCQRRGFPQSGVFFTRFSRKPSTIHNDFTQPR